MSLIGYALEMAKHYYEPETYEHALRVAANVANNPLVPEDKMDLSISLAIMHDLSEDTSYPEFNSIPTLLQPGMNLITRQNAESYIDYIKNISNNKETVPEAYWVKLADIKDHLTQTETLTERLKEKYLSVIHYLL